MQPIRDSQKLTYAELIGVVKELTKRVNALTQMQAVSVGTSGVPKFAISDTSAKFDFPNVGELLSQIAALEDELNSCNESQGDCENEVGSLEAQVAALEALVTPTEDPDGTGQWTLTTPVSHGCRFGQSKVSCAHTDKLSIEYDAGSSDFRFYRENSAGCSVNDGGVTVSAPGSVAFQVYSTLDYSGSPLTIFLSGARGATSEDNISLSNGTYYVRARSENIKTPDCSGFYATQSWQSIGSFTVTGSTVERIFNIIVPVEG